MSKRILGVVGTYRKGGIIDSLVKEIMLSAGEHGAETEIIYLIDKHVEFCTNCRKCTQNPGLEPGRCIHNDDMTDILARCDRADYLVIGAPVNCFNLTAVTRKFMERLACMAYWPWGQPGPKMRRKISGQKKAVLVTSTAMPAMAGRIFTGAVRALKLIAQTFGAKPVETIFVGLVAQKEKEVLSEKTVKQARETGRMLAKG